MDPEPETVAVALAPKLSRPIEPMLLPDPALEDIVETLLLGQGDGAAVDSDTWLGTSLGRADACCLLADMEFLFDCVVHSNSV